MFKKLRALKQLYVISCFESLFKNYFANAETIRQIITRCWPTKIRRCIPDVVLKNEGSMVQTSWKHKYASSLRRYMLRSTWIFTKLRWFQLFSTSQSTSQNSIPKFFEIKKFKFLGFHAEVRVKTSSLMHQLPI